MLTAKFKKKKGFTLGEIVIVLGMVMALSIVILPISISQLQKNKVENIAKDISSQLFLYQQYAYSGKDNKSYGIAFFTNKYSPYVGNSLSTADSSDNITFTNGIYISQINLNNSSSEIIFTKGSLKPNTYGTIALSDGGNTYLVEINAEGFVSSYKL